MFKTKPYPISRESNHFKILGSITKQLAPPPFTFLQHFKKKMSEKKSQDVPVNGVRLPLKFYFIRFIPENKILPTKNESI